MELETARIILRMLPSVLLSRAICGDKDSWCLNNYMMFPCSYTQGTNAAITLICRRDYNWKKICYAPINTSGVVQIYAICERIDRRHLKDTRNALGIYDLFWFQYVKPFATHRLLRLRFLGPKLYKSWQKTNKHFAPIDRNAASLPDIFEHSISPNCWQVKVICPKIFSILVIHIYAFSIQFWLVMQVW